MLITNMTRIGFQLPEEYQQMLAFIAKTEDIADWKKDEDTTMTYFTKVVHNTITLKGGNDG